ncbi:hypothetical protein [Reinekea sp. G2M2-21]|uniref:hypothetical protein n=1 Tax=Reinekea sp. G2M2-21 TaxID=2788942 RepID=UPI0018AAFDEF|nr:hypothetical protein [Reinekea sp. G2M2-21]
MEITSPAILSYQKNQNLPGLPAAIEATTPSGADPDTDSSPETEVRLSNRHQVYDWIAQEFPITKSSTDNIGRASQLLFEYQVLNFDELSTVNRLMNDAPANLLSSLDTELSSTTSFSQRQTLEHLKQVFSTLEAAERTYAA